MQPIKIIVITALLALVVLVGWRVGSCERANLQLQDDMHDLASQAAAHIGFSVPRSDDDFRDAVIRKAKEHGIALDPNQVTVQRSGSGMTTTVYLAADYRAPLNLPAFSFMLHFTPSSAK
jgi:ABC-type sugar transport system substrate-binding protein